MSVTTRQPLVIAKLRVLERNSAYVSGILRDETGTVVPLADLTAMTLTLKNDDDADPDDATAGVINARNAQDVLNTSGGTFHATTGAWSLTLGSADNEIVDDDLAHGQIERHTARLTFTFGTVGRFDGVIPIEVVALEGVD